MKWHCGVVLFIYVAFALAIASPGVDDSKPENLCDLCFCSGRTLRCDFRHNGTVSSDHIACPIVLSAFIELPAITVILLVFRKSLAVYAYMHA